MASKKKVGRKAGATTRGKKKASAGKAKAVARKAKASAGKAKASARKAKASASKAKASASKAKASASKAKASASKAKPGARKAKASARKAPARKRAPVAVEPTIVEQSSVSIIVDEVIEEPLLDVSTVLRIKDGVARAQRDVDEDELKQFPDPSLVVEAETSPPRDDDTDPSISHLPDLFAAEARRQKERLGDSAAIPVPKRQDSSLFGSLDPSDDDDDESGEN